MKTLKIAHVEGKDCVEELYKFLVAYHTTLQVKIGAAPAFLMFGRELRSKLPELRKENSLPDEGKHDLDWRGKVEGE